MDDKNQRLSVIRRLIQSSHMQSQEELLERLESEGFSITQATLSRDLKLLKVVKASDGKGGYFYTFIQDEGVSESAEILRQDFSRGFLSMDFSNNLGVVKTLPGHAQSVARALDQLKIPEILGTIAGDDTILIVPVQDISPEELAQGISKKTDFKGGIL
ncbi:MAG: arginine repressor [Spirochaetales bacterium]|nr:arginine repressor [Spirochaetales bacterium]